VTSPLPKQPIVPIAIRHEAAPDAEGRLQPLAMGVSLVEHVYSAENSKGKQQDMAKDEYIIIVNAEEHTIEQEKLTYEQVVELAYPGGPTGPDITYSVTFEHAKEPKQGTLSAGGSVEVKKRNTVFDVIQANRA
jgi:hypothetical protein